LDESIAKPGTGHKARQKNDFEQKETEETEILAWNQTKEKWEH